MLNTYYFLIISVIIIISTHITFLLHNINKTNNMTLNLTNLKTVLFSLIVACLLLSSNLNIKIQIAILISNLIIIIITTSIVPLLLIAALTFIFLISYNVNSIYELLITLELLNTITIFNIMSDKKLFISKKKTFVVLLCVNVIVLSTLVLLYFYSINKFKTTNLNVINLINLLQLDSNVQIMLTFLVLLKLGVLTGPKFNIIFYQNLSKNWLYPYIYTYYTLLPIILIQIISLINISSIFITVTILFTILINSTLFTNIKTYRDLLFLSGQFNILYIQLIMLI